MPVVIEEKLDHEIPDPVVWTEAEQGDEGPPGAPGAPGAQGPMGPAVWLEAEPGEDSAMGAPGLLAIPDPMIQRYAPGSFGVPTGRFVVLSRHLRLLGADRVALAGTAVLRIT
jgi:hypothetical protein